jgi:hypothetical protein
VRQLTHLLSNSIDPFLREEPCDLLLGGLSVEQISKIVRNLGRNIACDNLEEVRIRQNSFPNCILIVPEGKGFAEEAALVRFTLTSTQIIQGVSLMGLHSRGGGYGTDEFTNRRAGPQNCAFSWERMKP